MIRTINQLLVSISNSVPNVLNREPDAILVRGTHHIMRYHAASSPTHG